MVEHFDMGFYVELRPKDLTPLTVEEYKQRFLRAGLTPHADYYSDEKAKEKARNEVEYSGGIIIIFPDKGYLDDKGNPTGEGAAPCGVSANARMSWGGSAEEIERLTLELLDIAEAVNADLIFFKNVVIHRDNVHLVVERFLGGRRMFGQMFGFTEDSPDPQDPKPKT